MLLAALTAGTLSSCTAPPAPAPTPTPTISNAGAPGCRPASPISAPGPNSFPEVTATPSGGVAARGLLMGGSVPLAAGRETVKIVWRVTGRGPLRVAVHDPDGGAVPLVWGPEAHGDGSTYRAPGSEWGTGVRFARRGCWSVDLTRTGGTARAWFRVG